MTFWLVSMSKTYRGFRGCKRIEFEETSRGQKRKARWHSANGLLVLATSYSRTTLRRTTIGAAAFHCRVRNGNGWDHCATVTRGPSRTGGSLLRSDAGANRRLWGPGQLRAEVARSIALFKQNFKELSTIN